MNASLGGIDTIPWFIIERELVPLFATDGDEALRPEAFARLVASTS